MKPCWNLWGCILPHFSFSGMGVLCPCCLMLVSMATSRLNQNGGQKVKRAAEMTALKNCSLELRKYLLANKLPEVFEAILTGLAVECPADARAFVIEKLKWVTEDRALFHRLRWDSFISDDNRPKHALFRNGVIGDVDFLWSYEDENSQPSPEMYQRAYGLHNHKLKMLCLGAWIKYHLRKKLKRNQLKIQMRNARNYYIKRKLRRHFDGFYKWYMMQKAIQQEISNKLMQVMKLSLLRTVFKAWENVVTDARKTREYFERIENGEVIDVGEYGYFFNVSDDGQDAISSLPKHLALMIFSKVDLQDLGRCASVSRSWKLIIQSNIIWSKLDLTRIRHRLTNKVAAKLIHRYRSVLGHLNLRGCNNLTKKSLKIIGESRNLQDLNVSECSGVDDDVIKSITVGCSSLLYINLSQCKISDATLRTLARNCLNLQYLSLSSCPGFTDKGLRYLTHGKGARKLSYLDISRCEQITSQGFLMLSYGCYSLSTIILNELPSLQDEYITALTTHCCSIKSISILNSPLLSDTAFKCFALFHRLQKIRIEGNNRITDSSVKAIAKSCPDLRHVYLVDCPRLTDLSLKALSSCRFLVVLNIADCVRMQDAGVRQIVEGPSGSKLRELNLTNCVRVSDVTLLRIAQRCHSLTYCSICYCEHVTDAGVELLAVLPSLISIDASGCNIQDQGIAALGNCSRLKDVTLSECRMLTDLGLQKMCQQCRQLENLDLAYCANITDYAIKNLAFCCRLLRCLNLSGCKKLTDYSVQYLAGVCRYLETLDLSGCVLLTDRSLRFIRKGLKSLMFLNVLHCKNITKSAVRKLQAKVPRILYSGDEPPKLYGNEFLATKKPTASQQIAVVE